MSTANFRDVSLFPEVREWMEQAAREGEAYAHWKLALAHLERRYDDSTVHRAAFHLREATALGFRLAPVCLADLLASGAIAPLPGETVRGLLEIGAGLGHPTAQLQLGRMLLLKAGRNESMLLRGRKFLRKAEWNEQKDALLEGAFFDAIQGQATSNKGENQTRMHAAAICGNAKARRAFGLMIYHGYTRSPDHDRGIEVLVQAAHEGDVEAAIDLLHCCGLQKATENDAAVEGLLDSAISEGNARALYFYALNLYEDSLLGRKRMALMYLEQAHSAGYLPATVRLAGVYSKMEGKVPEAFELSLAAYRRGMAGICGTQLGHMALNRLQALNTADDALVDLVKSAAVVDSCLSGELGNLFDEGVLAARSQIKRQFWFYAGLSDGQHECARFLAVAIEPNWEKRRGITSPLSISFLEVAARSGDAYACALLADCYRDGSKEVVKNPTEAAKWFLRGAEIGYGYCQWWVGWCFANGFGVERNQERADFWNAEAEKQAPKTEQSRPIENRRDAVVIPFSQEKEKLA